MASPPSRPSQTDQTDQEFQRNLTCLADPWIRLRMVELRQVGSCEVFGHVGASAHVRPGASTDHRLRGMGTSQLAIKKLETGVGFTCRLVSHPLHLYFSHRNAEERNCNVLIKLVVDMPKGQTSTHGRRFAGFAGNKPTRSPLSPGRMVCGSTSWPASGWSTGGKMRSNHMSHTPHMGVFLGGMGTIGLVPSVCLVEI